MNLRINNFLVFFSLAPIWIFKFKIYNYNFLIILFVYLSICFFLNYLLKLLKDKHKKIYFLLIALVLTFGLDNHLSLHRELTTAGSFFADNFGGTYVSSIIILTIFFFLLSIVFILFKEKASRVFIFVLISLISFNLLDNSKSIKNIKNYDLGNNEKNYIPTIVLIFDEWSGMNSYESQTIEGKIFDKKLIELGKKHNLIIYENMFSSQKSTLGSISSLLNLKKNIEVEKVVIENNNFFSNYSLVVNKFFDKFKKVSVFQSKHVNYCEHKNVIKCSTYNALDKKEFIRGFLDTRLTYLINAWQLDGSISSLFVWRFLRQLHIIDALISPQGEKASLVFYFDQIIETIKSKRFDLIFSHNLVPHKPYGFDSECNYDGKKSLNNYGGKLSNEEHTLRHNFDRICMVKFIDEFLSKINLQKIEFNKIIIASDHGSRNIIGNELSELNNILIIKDFNSKFFQSVKEKKILQEEFRKIFN